MANIFPLNGVGLLKIGPNLGDVEEFYVVLLGGRVLPMKFKSWKEACEHFAYQTAKEVA